MTLDLHRYQHTRQGHFLTWSCYGRQPLLASAGRGGLFLSILEEVRSRYRFVVMGYVVMPEHVHMLVSEPEHGTLAIAIQVLKQRTARRLLSRSDDGEQHFWLKRYYDFSVWSEEKRAEKLNYMHQNPVQRGLVTSPELWAWSSYRFYVFSEDGPVKLNDWPEIWLGARPKT
jgi:REP-associated tyrosine transposase